MQYILISRFFDPQNTPGRQRIVIDGPLLSHENAESTHRLLSGAMRNYSSSTMTVLAVDKAEDTFDVIQAALVKICRLNTDRQFQ